MTDVPPSPAIRSPVELAFEPAERRDLARFIARNQPKFLPIYDARAAGRRWLPFCWPGFLFPQAWFLYRKMYLWAALTAAGPLLGAQFLHGAVFLSLPVSILGMLGRALYVRDARGAIARIRILAADEAEVEDMIARAGGVSRLGAALGSVFTVASLVLAAKGGAPISPAGHS